MRVLEEWHFHVVCVLVTVEISPQKFTYQKQLILSSSFVCVFMLVQLLQMVFGNCGVLLETSSAKGYVEMTGIDAETSQDIAEVSMSFTG